MQEPTAYDLHDLPPGYADAAQIAARSAELGAELEAPLTTAERDAIAVIFSAMQIVAGRDLTRAQCLSALADRLTRSACDVTARRADQYRAPRCEAASYMRGLR